MILCLDLGNSQIFGGVFKDERLLFSFRHATVAGTTSDQLGIFLRNVLRENHLQYGDISNISICSVVPNLDYSLRAACRKYFDIDAFFLQAASQTGLDIQYHQPSDLGADRIANAIAATHLYPQQNLIVFDFGTATTVCAINQTKAYLGGAILAGIRIAIDALQTRAAKLFPVEILKPAKSIGRSTLENLQAGIFYGHVGIIREMIQRITSEAFFNQNPIVIGTGGFAHLFEAENLFTVIVPDLVLQGLRLALLDNISNQKN
jgi:type III pantothenate kinase